MLLWEKKVSQFQTHGGATVLRTIGAPATHLLQLAVNMLDYQVNGHHISTTLEGKKNPVR